MAIARGRFVVLIGAFLLLPTDSHAQAPVVYHWNSSVSTGNWSLSSNWVGSAPSAGGGSNVVLEFDSTTFPSTNDLSGTFTLNGLNLKANSSSVVLDGNPLRFATGTSGPFINTFNTSTVQIKNAVVLANTLTTSGSGSLEFSGPISGTGGLTLNNDLTTIYGTNSFTGTVSVNTGVLLVDSTAALGTGTGSVQLGSSANPTFTTPGLGAINQNGSFGTVDVSRNLSLTGSAGTFTTLQGPSAALKVSGNISGSAGLTILGGVTLTGTNTYTGPTQIAYGELSVNSDAALGNAGASIQFGLSMYLGLPSTLRLAAAFDTTRNATIFDFSTAVIDTNGFNSTWAGSIGGANTPFEFDGRQFIKDGLGTLTLTGASTYNSSARVQAGELRLTGNGSLPALTFEIARDSFYNRTALLTLDNTITNKDTRLDPLAQLTLTGAELKLLGNDTTATNQVIGSLFLNVDPMISTITIVPGTGGAATFTADSYSNGANQILLVRGTNLGTASGAQLIFNSGVNATTIPLAIGDASTTGAGNTFVTYDAAFGVRPLTESEYFNTIVPGTSTTQDVKLTGSLTGLDGVTSIQTLTLAGTGGNLSGSGTLALSYNAILATAPNWTLNVGTLSFNQSNVTGQVMLGASDGASLTINSVLSFDVYNSTITKVGNGTVLLNGAVPTPSAGNPGVSQISVAAGTLELGAAATFSTANLFVAPGAVLSSPFDQTFTSISGSGTINIGAQHTLTIAGPSSNASSQVAYFDGTITGGGSNLVVRNFQVLNLGGANSYTGATTIGEGTILALDLTGSLTASPITILGAMELDNTNVVKADRVSSAANIQMMAGSLTLFGNSAASVSQSFNALQVFPGDSQISLVGDGFDTTLNIAGSTPLVRSNGSTLSVISTQSSASAAATIAFANTPTLVGGGGSAGSPSISILPYAVWNGGRLTTVAGGVLRPLSDSEMATLNPGTSTTNNVLVNGNVLNLNATTMVNSLTIESFSNVTVSGSGSLAVTSGAVLITGGSSETVAINVPLNFGTAEAIFQVYGTDSAITRPIAGSGGLTKAGLGNLTLSGASTFTGPTIINQGTLAIASDVINNAAGPLGNSSAAVTLVGIGYAGLNNPLSYYSAATLALLNSVTQFQRPLVVAAGLDSTLAMGTIQGSLAPSSTDFTGTITLNRSLTIASAPAGLSPVGVPETGYTFDGTISGAGGLAITAGTTTINGTNTYTGGTVIGNPSNPSNAVSVNLGNDSALGSGTITIVGDTTFAASSTRTIANPIQYQADSTTSFASVNDLTFTGGINLASTSNINFKVTNSGNITIASAIRSDLTTSFTKSGWGTLTLTADNPVGATFDVNQGRFLLTSSGKLANSSNFFAVDRDATLELDNSITNINNRLFPLSQVALNRGEFKLDGGTGTQQALSYVFLSGTGTITVAAGSTQSALLTIGHKDGFGETPTLLRGDNLGSAIGTGVATIKFGTALSLIGGTTGAGTPGVKILPLTIGDTSSTGLGIGPVTYDNTNGIRLLNSNEYSTTLTSSTTNNIKLLDSVAINSTTFVNTLFLDAGTSTLGAVTGTGTLRINSGVLTAFANGGISVNTLQFGTNTVAAGAAIAVNTGETLTITSALSDFSGNLPLAKFGGGTLELNGTIADGTVVPSVDVVSGTLKLGSAIAFPDADFYVRAGALLDLGGSERWINSLSGSGNIEIGALLNIGRPSDSATYSSTFDGIIDGTGGLTVAGALRTSPDSSSTNTFTLTGVNTFSGETNVPRGAQLTLKDGGRLANTNAITVGGTLLLEASRGDQSLGSAALNVTGGTVSFAGGLETLGAFTVGEGQNRIRFSLPADISATSFTRTDRGTLQLEGSFGDVNSATGTSTFSTSGGVSLSGGASPAGIVPYIAGQANILPTVTGLGLVTYDSVLGLRPLTAAEYNPIASGSGAGGNVLITTSSAISSNTTLNALAFVSADFNGITLGGSNTINITSGAVTSTGTIAVNPTLSFAAAEAIFHVGGSELSSNSAPADILTLNGSVLGTNGLTKAGAGTLVIGGNANVTGTTNVNAGSLLVNNSLTATNVTVHAGATLGGTGSIAAGSMTVNELAVLSPGSAPLAIGTLNVTGNVTIAGFFTADVKNDTTLASGTPPASDRLNVTGHVTLSSTSVLILPYANTFENGTTYTIIHATGGVDGAFSTYVGSLDPNFQILYTANDVLLYSTPIPEPEHAFAIAAVVVAALAMRRNRVKLLPTAV